MRFESYTLEYLPAIIAQIQKVYPDERNFFLSGDLGAGKTTFTRQFCKALGVSVPVTSPSFTLMHQYPFEGGTVYHLDLYRLNTEEEVYELGIEEILFAEGYKLIEWMNKFPGIKRQGLELIFEILPDFKRSLLIRQVS